MLVYPDYSRLEEQCSISSVKRKDLPYEPAYESSTPDSTGRSEHESPLRLSHAEEKVAVTGC